MEVAGLAISTLTVAKVCLQTANVIEATRGFRSDLQSLYRIYNFEHVRLTLWLVQVLGVQTEQGTVQNYKPENVQMPEYLGPTSPLDLQAPLRAALYEVQKLLTDIKQLLAKYDGIPDTNQGQPNDPSTSNKTKVSFSRLIKFQTKVYKEGDKEKLKALLKDLKDWNDRLDGITGSRLRGQLLTSLRNRVVASVDTDEELQVVEEVSRTSYPGLSNEIAFKRRHVAIDRSGVLPDITLKLNLNTLRPSQPPEQQTGNNLRALGWTTLGSTGNVRVLQEWKLGQLDWDAREVALVRDRSDRLARVLHLDNKPQQLCCLDLLGYATKDSASGNRTRLDVCFLYRLPSFADHSSAPATLLETLDLPDGDRPSLAEKFSLAITLAESVLCFHSHNWIHKAICSSNIVFFHDSQNRRLVYSKPFVAGFEFARPDTATDRTLDAFEGSDFETFCHPDLKQTLHTGRSTRPRYQRQYDIYGLGIVLLEIGCWLPGTVCLESRTEDSPTSDHEYLLWVCDESVPTRMGSKYRDVVRACLTWRADDEKSSVSLAQSQEGRDRRRNQVEEFMYTVVDALRSCHCRL